MTAESSPASSALPPPDPATAARARTTPGVGIRTRIVVGYVALLAAALAVSTLVTRQVLHARLDRQIDASLVQEVEELRLLATGSDPTTGEPFGHDVAAIFDEFLSRTVPSDHEAMYTLIAGEPGLRSYGAPASLIRDPAIVEIWASATEPQVATIRTAEGPARSMIVPLSSDGTVLGTFVVVHFPGADRAEIAQHLRIVMVAGAVVLAASALVAWSLAGRVLRPVRHLTATARSISDADLSARIPVEGRDELAELGRTFNAMLDRLQAGFDQQRRFLDDVAHELRTPITIAQGHLDVLGDDPAERDETIAIVTDELDRMARYVSDLLLLAKAERADFLRVAPVDVGELAASTLRSVSGLADRDWTLDDAPEPGTATIDADGSRLSQALLNLASNAIDHTGTGDVIGIGVAVDHTPLAQARLWVRDTGSGIDPQLAASLFRRSTRGASSRVSRPDGLGVGLSIVDAIARSHGGRVDVSSTPGAGARFEITIPLTVPLTVPLPSPVAGTSPTTEEHPA